MGYGDCCTHRNNRNINVTVNLDKSTIRPLCRISYFPENPNWGYDQLPARWTNLPHVVGKNQRNNPRCIVPTSWHIPTSWKNPLQQPAKHHAHNWAQSPLMEERERSPFPHKCEIPSTQVWNTFDIRTNHRRQGKEISPYRRHLWHHPGRHI